MEKFRAEFEANLGFNALPYFLRSLMKEGFRLRAEVERKLIRKGCFLKLFSEEGQVAKLEIIYKKVRGGLMVFIPPAGDIPFLATANWKVKGSVKPQYKEQLKDILERSDDQALSVGREALDKASGKESEGELFERFRENLPEFFKKSGRIMKENRGDTLKMLEKLIDYVSPRR